MKTEPSFRQFANAFLAAGAPGASERGLYEAEAMAHGLPFQYLTEETALKVLIRDLDTRKLVNLNRQMVPQARASIPRGAPTRCLVNTMEPTAEKPGGSVHQINPARKPLLISALNRFLLSASMRARVTP
jgi:hypothetical protein